MSASGRRVGNLERLDDVVRLIASSGEAQIGAILQRIFRAPDTMRPPRLAVVKPEVDLLLGILELRA